MNKNLGISVLVPIYGTEQFIERCARSIFEQTWENIEPIFVDDCTPDKSIEILKRVINDYPKRKASVKIIHHEKNRGLSAARNTALDNVTGDYFMHVDSDDYLENDAIRQLAEIVNNKPTDIVIFDNYINYPQKEVVNHVNYTNRDSFIHDMLMKKRPSSVWNKLYNTNFYKKCGMRSIEGINYGEDYAITSRLMYKTESIIYYPVPLYHYEQRNTDSYTKNIKVSSVISMYNADCINVDFFSKYSSFINKEKLEIIKIRSMLVLIKRGVDKDGYKALREYYPSSLLTHSATCKLSLVDRLFCFFYKKNNYRILQLLNWMYVRVVK